MYMFVFFFSVCNQKRRPSLILLLLHKQCILCYKLFESPHEIMILNHRHSCHYAFMLSVILIVQIQGKSSILEALNSHTTCILDYSSKKEFAPFESKFFP